jgi:hypothetical protein
MEAGTDWAPTEPCVTCGHPYSLHVHGGCAAGEDMGANNCGCKLFMAANRPGEGHSIGEPSPQGVLLLADNVEAMRLTFASFLGTWQMIDDDPEVIAQKLVEAGVSATGVAESLEGAVRNMRLVIDAIS